MSTAVPLLQVCPSLGLTNDPSPAHQAGSRSSVALLLDRTSAGQHTLHTPGPPPIFKPDLSRCTQQRPPQRPPVPTGPSPSGHGQNLNASLIGRTAFSFLHCRGGSISPPERSCTAPLHRPFCWARLALQAALTVCFSSPLPWPFRSTEGPTNGPVPVAPKGLFQRLSAHI
ncbi:hypothetical protein NDU88_002700 [Pleurodeles waltl]|uniref:Uncharacterized protein n=1 Tax=Pleurodeles waltl TaxID=8319 RepID=A0AAV7T451_PLEWA|nr:hypothetical protein NDU88_002700 [Pleurodeles waltl]